MDLRFTTATNTLSLMHASAVSRGLPHQTIRNLSLINLDKENFIRRKERAWWGRYPQTDPSYRVPNEKDQRQWAAVIKKREEASLADHASSMLLETMKMAEGRSGLVLGKPRYVRYVPPWWRIKASPDPPATPEMFDESPIRSTRVRGHWNVVNNI